MDNKFPILTGMGIINPNQIVRYAVQTSGDYDVLRVVYKRASGSLLPGTKKFKFKRVSRTREEDAGAHKTFKHVSEINPALSSARTELDKVVNTKHSQKEQLAVIQDEIIHLEEEMHTRIVYLKSLVENFKD